VLPDEPRGAIRPDLAVSALWPLLTLMLIGPLAGFAWLAFNSWALGCRHAARHAVIALVAVPMVGISVIAIAQIGQSLPDGVLADNSTLIARLSLIVVHASALVLAFWIMIDQDEAEQWRKTFGPPMSNGAKLFVPLLIVRVFAGHLLPGWLGQFVVWTGG
jgi:hypothetical protein